MESIRFQDIFDLAPSSGFTREEGLESGRFPFYTPGLQVSAFYPWPQHILPALIINFGSPFSVRFEDQPFSTSKGLDVFYCKKEFQEKINIKYVYYLFIACLDTIKIGLRWKKRMDRCCWIMNMQIPFLPLIRQNQIVAIMEQVMELAVRRKGIIENLQNYQKALFLEKFGDPVINPKKFPLKKIKYIIPYIESGESPICEEFPRENEDQYAVLRQDAITKYFFDPEQNKYLSNRNLIKRNRTVKRGDVLFARKNDLKHIGATVYVFDECQNLQFPDTIYRLKYDPKQLSGIYLTFVMNNSNFHKKLTKYTTGTMISMSNISIENLKLLDLPVPPINLQKEFEDKVLLVQPTIKSMENQVLYIQDFVRTTFGNILFQEVEISEDFELEILLSNIDINRQDINCSAFYDDAILNLLKSKLNGTNEGFKDNELYEKARYVLFNLLKNGILKQKFDAEQKKINID